MGNSTFYPGKEPYNRWVLFQDKRILFLLQLR